jgi:hypothetical protein
MSVDTNDLHTFAAEVANMDDAEEELEAKDSPIRDCLFGRYFKSTMAAICLLPLKCCATIDFPYA